MEEQVNEKTIGIMIRTGETAGRALYYGAKNLVAGWQQKGTVQPTPKREKSIGAKVKVKDLLKDNSDVQIVDIRKEGLKDFEKYARKYHVRYAVERDRKTKPPTYYIFFRGKDGEVINQALSHFVKDQMERAEKRGSIKEKLTHFLEQAAKQPKKSRNKEQVR